MLAWRRVAGGGLVAIAGALALAVWASAAEPTHPTNPLNAPNPSNPSASSSLSAASIPAGRDFGAGLTLSHVADLEEVVRDPSRYAEGPVLLRGRISDVCQKKGCWTVLSQGQANLRVRFKDYGFFLPSDSSGKQAYVEGVVKVETLSEKTARHYAKESQGGNADAIHGPQREVGFTASGVRLVGD